MQLQGVTGVAADASRVPIFLRPKKRLALIVTFVEQRPVLVFDEVAADQDPGFRKYFYEALLRRAANHYFHVADRVLRMEAGRFTEYAA
jgi:ABC-type siderophore export system fused ATPase/permease subunit